MLKFDIEAENFEILDVAGQDDEEEGEEEEFEFGSDTE